MTGSGLSFARDFSFITTGDISSISGSSSSFITFLVHVRTERLSKTSSGKNANLMSMPANTHTQTERNHPHSIYPNESDIIEFPTGNPRARDAAQASLLRGFFIKNKKLM